MRIALIRPELGYYNKHLTIPYSCLQPYSLSILAGLTPPDIEVVAFDDRMEELPYDQSWDLVALSVGTFQARRSYEIADAFRARGTKVIMGGFHPSFCPDEASPHVDSIAIGEAEELWPGIIEDARRGKLKPRYEQAPTAHLAQYLPRPSIFKGKKYLPMSVVQFCRGCRFNCDFCCIKAFYKGPARHRAIDNVIKEIAEGGNKWVFFVDDNLVADKEKAKILLRELIPLKLNWVSQTSLDLADDPELVELMVKSGCRAVVIGLESLNPNNMKQMGKGWSNISEYEKKLDIIRSNGIMIYGTFVFGYDGDTLDVFDRTLDWALKQKFFLSNFNHLQPYPGTRLYERLKQEGRLVYDKWWLDPNYRFGEAVFHPRNMTPEQLTDAAFRARSKFHSYRGIAKRMFDFKANFSSVTSAFTFLATNIISRQDIHKKQGVKLGTQSASAAGFGGNN